MANEQLLDRVTIDSAVCHGQPCIRATRVLVTVVLHASQPACRLPRSSSTTRPLTVDDVRAAAAYGVWLAKQGDPRTVGDLVKIKLDENITAAAKQLFAAHGHECHTVPTRN